MLVAPPTSLKMAAAAVSNLPMCRRTSEPELSLNYDPCSPLGGNACLRSVPWKKSYSKQEHESRILTKGRCRTNIQCVQSSSSTLEYSNKTETSSPMLSASDAPGFQIAAEKAEMLGRTNDVMLAGSNNQHGDKRPSLEQIIKPVEEDLRILNNNLQSIVGAQNALLTAAAEQIFSAGGKRMRPAIVLLVSKATSDIAGHKDLTTQHRRLAEITEMIHTASLIHDDVLDESSVRRGKETLHQLYGTRIAVLAGDFMFAQSSWYLANLENLEVIKLISEVIKDFANGEIQQAASLFDCDLSLEDYLDKSYYKTASLIAASTRSASIFSHVDSYIHDQMFLYGKHLGLAFQIVDDILDFTQSTGQLGKPAGSDLIKGNLTAPVLFALETQPELRALIETEFTDNGSLDAAISLVKHGGGIDKARELARQKANLALQNLQCLPKGPAKLALEEMVEYVLERAY